MGFLKIVKKKKKPKCRTQSRQALCDAPLVKVPCSKEQGLASGTVHQRAESPAHAPTPATPAPTPGATSPRCSP